jgi:hypothetical protein
MIGFVRCAVVLGTLAAAGCGGSPSAPGDVPYGTRVDIKAGKPVRIGDDGLKTTFTAVTSESRCPMDALCIDSGNAVLAFRFEVDGGAIDRDLHTKAGQTAVPIDGFAVTLLALDPYPRSDCPIAPSDYVAQIRVDKK